MQDLTFFFFVFSFPTANNLHHTNASQHWQCGDIYQKLQDPMLSMVIKKEYESEILKIKLP